MRGGSFVTNGSGGIFLCVGSDRQVFCRCRTRHFCFCGFFWGLLIYFSWLSYYSAALYNQVHYPHSNPLKRTPISHPVLLSTTSWIPNLYLQKHHSRERECNFNLNLNHLLPQLPPRHFPNCPEKAFLVAPS